MGKIILYHYTSYETSKIIMREGLRGGDNRHGTAFDLALLRQAGIELWDPILFLTAVYREDNERYGGYLLQVEVDEEKVTKIDDDCYIMKGEGILIPPEDITDMVEEYRRGGCYGDQTPLCWECDCLDCEYNPDYQEEEEEEEEE
nr:MAG: hypothetical protein [Lokiarchaeota virus Skoll Meg22_1214]